MLDDPVPGRHLLVASTGGHLAQLWKWSHKIGSDQSSVWVTFKSPQAEGLLEGRRVIFVPYAAPRDVKNVSRAFVQLMQEINWRKERFSAAVTTGAAVGIAGLAAARLHRVPAFYFESVSRVAGPSLSGRLAQLDPFVKTSCQYPHWEGRRWKYRGSLFEEYHTVNKTPIQRPRLFISLGTIKPYRFDSLIDAVLATGLADDRTVWQVGATSGRQLPGRVHSQVTAAEFEQFVNDADVVITHAGVGTIMALLDKGRYPVVVPRIRARNEHIDDHQCQIADLLRARSIAWVVSSEELNREGLIRASGFGIGAAPP